MRLQGEVDRVTLEAGGVSLLSRISAGLLSLSLCVGQALAQGSPGAIPGQILTDGTGRLTSGSTSASWLNNAFASKQNYSPSTNCVSQLLSPSANTFLVFNGDGTCTAASFGSGLTYATGVLSASGISTPITPGQGGTGVINPSGATYTSSQPVTLSGGYATTLNVTGITSVTLPQGSHTLASWDLSNATAAALSNLCAAAITGGNCPPSVVNNAALEAVPVSQVGGVGGLPVLRLGVNTPGDAPAVWFSPENACPYTVSGAGDIGGCNQSADGKWWVASYGALGVDAREFGGTWDSLHDVGAPINAAIVAAAGLDVTTVNLPAGTYGESTPISNQISGIYLRTIPTAAPLPWYMAVNEQPNAPTALKWIGSTATIPFYMLSAVPVTGVSGTSYLHDERIDSLVLDCNETPGCGGFHGASIQIATFNVTAWNPVPATINTTGSSNTAGSATLNIASTTGLAVGEAVTGAQGVTLTASAASGALTVTALTGTLAPGEALQDATGNVENFGGPNIITKQLTGTTGSTGTYQLAYPSTFTSENLTASDIIAGTFIASINSGTQIGLTSQIASSIAASTAIGFGGEGIRLDVTGPLATVNDMQNITGSLRARNTTTLTGTTLAGPGVVLGAVNTSGNGGAGGSELGNFSGNDLSRVECSQLFSGVCLEIGYSDHNDIHRTGGTTIMTGGLSSTLPQATNLTVDEVGNPIFVAEDSTFGGYTENSYNAWITKFDAANGGAPYFGPNVTTSWYQADNGISKVGTPDLMGTYTPTITCGSGAVGAYSTQTGKYSLGQFGGWSVAFTVQAAPGTCSGTETVSLPAAGTVTNQPLYVIDETSGAAPVPAFVAGASVTAYSLTAGHMIVGSGTYQ